MRHLVEVDSLLGCGVNATGRLAALVALLVSCDAGPTGPDLSAPAAINMVSGNLQAARRGYTLDAPYVVQVLDGRGRPVPVARVDWQVETGDGTISPATSFTNEEGLAEALLTLGDVLGEQRVLATHGDLLPVEFVGEARPLPPHQVTLLSGDGQSALEGTTLPEPMVVRVTNERDEPMAGVAVTFSASGFATPSASVVNTGADGVASTTWSLGLGAGHRQLLAQVTGASPVAAFAEALPIPVGEIQILGGSAQTALVDEVLPTPISIRVVDALGMPIVRRTVLFQPSGSGSVDEWSRLTDDLGQATNVWRLGRGAGAQTLTVRVTDVELEITATATAAAPNALVLVSVGPLSGGRTQALPLPVVVEVRDRFENPTPGIAVAFTAAAGDGGFSLSNPTTDALGRISATWTLGDALGAMHATAAVAGVPPLALEAQATPPVHRLDDQIVDVEYHAASDRLVTVSVSPSQLRVLDPDTRTGVVVALPRGPTSVSISPDGTHAVVGHDGWISYVDLSGGSLLRTIEVGMPVGDVVLAGNGFAHTFPPGHGWGDVRSVNLSTDAVEVMGQVYGGFVARLHPVGDHLYGTDNNISPADLQKFDLRGGAAVRMYDSPYHGHYSIGRDLWYSPEGDRVYTAFGTVFRSTTVAETDLRYLTSMDGTGVATWIEHSAIASRVLALSRSGWSEPLTRQLRVYDVAFLTFRGELLVAPIHVPDVGSVPADARFAFFTANGATVHVLVRAPDSAGLASNWALVSYATAELP